jgi:hypothetical protein
MSPTSGTSQVAADTSSPKADEKQPWAKKMEPMLGPTPTPADLPAGTASGMEAAPVGSDDALAAKPAPIAQSKQWGTVLVTLKDYSVRGGVVSVVLLMKNQSDKEETISSLLFFEALSEEGDLGENDWTNNNCDGTIPPNGVFKCQLGFTFRDAPKEVSLRVGAGFLADAVYFNLTAPIPLAAR